MQTALFDAALAPIDQEALPASPIRYTERPQLPGAGWCTGWWRSVPDRPEYAPWPLLECRDTDDGFDYRFTFFVLADGVCLVFRPGSGRRCLETADGERLELHEAVGRGLAWEMT